MQIILSLHKIDKIIGLYIEFLSSHQEFLYRASTVKKKYKVMLRHVSYKKK